MTSAGELIAILNPKIRGWGNYYRHAVSSKTFRYVNHQIFESLYRWAKRRHPNKSVTWIVKKYYRMDNANEWRLHGQTRLKDGRKRYHQLIRMNEIPIVRHVKIIGEANPYDPNYQEYFNKRSGNNNYRNVWEDMPKLLAF